MPFHIIGNRILTDEEFKEERDGWMKWVFPLLGYIGILVGILKLFPDWGFANIIWWPIILLIVAYLRAGLFHMIGGLIFIGGCCFGIYIFLWALIAGV